jgi:hypothetical protein
MASSAPGSPHCRWLGNRGLAHFDSDGGVQLEFALTDQNGQPVGKLTKDEVQVFEDEQAAESNAVIYRRRKNRT